MTLVLQNLYIGGLSQCDDENWLRSHKITHIVNCSREIPNYFTSKFRYLNLFLDDTPHTNIIHACASAKKFIDEATLSRGTILVHCHMGISRSASIVIYYLMKTFGMNFESAQRFLKSLRPEVCPNIGFKKQLYTF